MVMGPLKPRILFVEDHEDTRDFIALVLQESQHEVATTDNIGDTLKLAQRGNFNLFIFDSLLPDGSGVDLCKQIRSFDQQTPILFYSGLAQEKDVNLALNAGAQAYLIKPVEVPQLLQAVRDLIAKEGSIRATNKPFAATSSSL